MKKKIAKLFLWIVLSVVMLIGIVVSEKNSCSIGVALAGAFVGIFIEKVWNAGVDIGDSTNWKASQTRLIRGGFIKKDTLIRISFAYLYRIKIDGKYLLVKNSRKTKKYQPVGGVYKFEGNERQVLKNLFHIADDDKIPIDNSSRNDYRLRMESRYLRGFVKRFNSKKASRERVENLGREFKEELIETGFLNWNRIQYRYCGRHMTEIRFEEHFQTYELLMFDVVELIPSTEQERELVALLHQKGKDVHFATAEQICSLGVDVSAGKLDENIGDHTKFTLQEYEARLEKISNVGKIYEVPLK